MFPEGAGYEHDKMERRVELSDDQRPVEPPNADSHLAFMAGALRTCVVYQNKPGEPVSFIDLDGVHAGTRAPAIHLGARLQRRGTCRSSPPGRARFGSRRRLRQSEEPAVRDLRAVRRSGARPRRHQGAAAHLAGARRAACRVDGQRVRNAADAARPLGRAPRSVAVHGGEGRTHARQSARDSGQDARLRQVRPGSRLQPPAGYRWPAGIDAGDAHRPGDRDAGGAVPAHEARRQPARVGSSVARRWGDRRRHLPEPDSRAVAPRREDASARSTSPSHASPETAEPANGEPRTRAR